MRGLIMTLSTGASLNIFLASNVDRRPERDDELVSNLLGELHNIPSIEAVRAKGIAPQNSKSIGAQLPQIIIGLGAAGALLPTIANVIRDWLTRQPAPTKLRIKDGDFEFEWSGATPTAEIKAQVAQMIEKRRH